MKKSTITMCIFLIASTVLSFQITYHKNKSIATLKTLNSEFKNNNTQLNNTLEKQKLINKSLNNQNAKLIDSNKSKYSISSNQYIANKNLDQNLISLIFEYFNSLQNKDIETYNQIVGDNKHLKSIYNIYKGKEYNILKIDAGDKIPQNGGFFVTVNFHNNDCAYIAVIKKNDKWEIYGWD